MSTLSKRLEPIVESSLFNRSILSLIIFNALIIGLETYPSVADRFGGLLQSIDQAIVWIFVVEISLRWLAWHPRHRFLLNGWNLFDFVIIAASLLPGAAYLSITRIFRVLRLLRAFRFLPSMQRLVVALLKSIPSLGHILFLMLILFYIYGVTGTFLFGKISPEHFGTLHQSLLTLFQVATLEGWAEIFLVISGHLPWAWLYFISFIVIGTFVALNLVVGVIVSNLQAAAQAEENSSTADDMAQLKRSLQRIEAELAKFNEGRRSAVRSGQFIDDPR